MTADATLPEFRRYRRTEVAEMADWYPGFDMSGVSISEHDRAAGSPRPGDKIARNPNDHSDRWLVAEAYFRANFAPIEEDGAAGGGDVGARQEDRSSGGGR